MYCDHSETDTGRVSVCHCVTVTAYDSLGRRRGNPGKRIGFFVNYRVFSGAEKGDLRFNFRENVLYYKAFEEGEIA